MTDTLLIVAVMGMVMASIRSNGGRGGDGRGGTSVLWEDLQRGQKLPLRTSFQSIQDVAQVNFGATMVLRNTIFYLKKKIAFFSA